MQFTLYHTMMVYRCNWPVLRFHCRLLASSSVLCDCTFGKPHHQIYPLFSEDRLDYNPSLSPLAASRAPSNPSRAKTTIYGSPQRPALCPIDRQLFLRLLRFNVSIDDAREHYKTRCHRCPPCVRQSSTVAFNNNKIIICFLISANSVYC